MSSGQKQYNVPNQPSKPVQSGGPVVGGTHVFNLGQGVGATIVGSLSPTAEAMEQMASRVVCPKCGSEVPEAGMGTITGIEKCKRCGATFSIEGGVACTLDDEEQKNDQDALKDVLTKK